MLKFIIMKVVILAGGAGTRLWPLSRQSKPKQVLPIIGKQTLLEQTYKRLRLKFRAGDIFVATGKDHAKDVARQLPELDKHNIFIEPVRRDSAGAIGLVASRVYAEDPEEILISVHADSWIDNDKKFVDLLSKAEVVIKKYPNYTLMFGIKPLYPETGYGYINVNKKVVQEKSFCVYSVKRFIEKPNLSRAHEFVKSKKYFWNPGWFAWRVDNLMELYKKYLPKNFSILEKMSSAPCSRFQKFINKEFPKLKSASIDRAIHEKTKKIFVIPADIQWTDIGHFRSVAEMSESDKDCNTIYGKSVLLDSSNNFLMTQSNKLIAGIGVKNIIMVETKDVILLIHKDKAQDVKKVVEFLKKKNLKKYL